MGLRFRRSLKLLPGLRVSVGLRGASLSTGVRGASLNFGRQGVHANVGLPGTGISVRQKLASPKLSVLSPRNNVIEEVESTHTLRLKLDLDEDGRLEIRTPEGLQLPPAVERIVRQDGEGELRAWLEEECANRNGRADALSTLHEDVPA